MYVKQKLDIIWNLFLCGPAGVICGSGELLTGFPGGAPSPPYHSVDGIPIPKHSMKASMESNIAAAFALQCNSALLLIGVVMVSIFAGEGHCRRSQEVHTD